MRRFLRDESGAEFVEWVVVTLILIVATYALLQAVGPEVSALAGTILERVGNILGK